MRVTNRNIRRFILSAAFLWSTSALLADMVILKNGVILEGVVYDQNPHILRVQKEGGAALTIRKSQVIRVIYGDRVEELQPEKSPETRRPVEKKPDQRKNNFEYQNRVK